MPLTRYAVLIGMLAAGCGGEAPQPASQVASEPAKKNDASKIDACALLTSEEIEAAAGWKPAKTEPQTHQTTATCTYQGSKPLTQIVVLVVARPAPKLASSAAMAEWRTRQVSRDPDIKLIMKPIEGLGVPAISNELEGSGKPSLEAAKNGRLLGVTASNLEVAKAFAAKAIPRLP